MNVLFVTYECYPYKSATSNCVRAIIEIMRREGIDVGLINLTGNSRLPKEVEDNGVWIYNIFDESYASARILYLEKQYLPLLRTVALKIMIKLRLSVYRTSINRIRKVLNQYAEGYDLLIPVCSAFQTACACMEYCACHKKKYLLYQVDPIGTNKAYDNQLFMEKLEEQIYRKASYIITTPIIAKEKKNNPAYDHAKILPLEFPNIRNLTAAKVNGDAPGREIKLFYSGRFYAGVRDCSFALKVFSLIQNERVRIVFAGTGQESVFSEYRNGALHGKLELLGEISLEESFSHMQRADILINIGNNVMNQVPSKLFDYISTGKPIINFCEFKECPTIPYLEKYGNAISVVNGERSMEEQAQLVHSFILSNLGKAMNFDEITSKFSENTAEYVGKCFIDAVRATIRDEAV